MVIHMFTLESSKRMQPISHGSDKKYMAIQNIKGYIFFLIITITFIEKKMKEYKGNKKLSPQKEAQLKKGAPAIQNIT